ncbi:hypothetical protein [Streptomyces rubiginosohelvolus]|uniref:hypothetical protein n=1 Tax=Streptomyces rubiginosohelvolus TaxID=67362 RepID=UPI00369FDA42
MPGYRAIRLPRHIQHKMKPQAVRLTRRQALQRPFRIHPADDGLDATVGRRAALERIRQLPRPGPAVTPTKMVSRHIPQDLESEGRRIVSVQERLTRPIERQRRPD